MPPERVSAVYLTDATHRLEKVPGIVTRHGQRSAIELPPRSLTTLVRA